MKKREAVGISLLFAIGLGVSGCSMPSTNAENSVPSQSASPTPSSKPSESQFKIPSDFPSDIPIRDGVLVLSSVAGSSPNQTWAIEVLVDDLDQARVDTINDLESAGFTLIDESGVGTDTYLATLSRHDYEVRIKVYLEPETGELEVRYVVTPN